MDIKIQEFELKFSRLEFFEEWVKYPKIEKNSQLLNYISRKFILVDITEKSKLELVRLISRFSHKIEEKWHASAKNRDRFLQKNNDWLKSDLTFILTKEEPQPSCSFETRSVGRPKKDFKDASQKTKKRRVEDLVKMRTVDELTTAAELSIRLSGQRNVAEVIKDVSAEPEKAKEIKKILRQEQTRQLTSDEALAYYVDSKATKASYKLTRKWAVRAGHQLYPSYYSLQKAKNRCYPPEEFISVTETCAEIRLQALLDLTIQRLVAVQSTVITAFFPSPSFTLVSKWGCDGSSGHSRYKQKFSNPESTDEYLFVFSIVPVRLYTGDTVVWQNPRPSSTMYCRPIKFLFAKESDALTLRETNALQDQIQTITSTKCIVDDAEISINHQLLLTMIDGKVCNALTGTRSTQKCYICGATPKNMNDELFQVDSNKDNYGFGLSTLHAWIRSFECLLHISYRLDVKKWQVKESIDKASVQERKARIQAQFKDKMGLIIDRPKPGFGSTNDGNTARRFFRDADKSAEITGLDVILIKRICILLSALASGFDINLPKYTIFAEETRKLYLNLYSWYCMPVTLHKIFVHSSEIIKTSLLPIGKLSEEAQEARNKDCRRYREHHTRKSSRVTTNRDLLSMLLITSDPVISSLREAHKKKFKAFSKEVTELLISPVEKNIAESSISKNHSSSEDSDASETSLDDSNASFSDDNS